jgi:hypothetical protein
MQRKIEKDFKFLIKFMKKDYPEIYKYCIEMGKLNDDILSFNKEYIKKWATHHQSTE